MIDENIEKEVRELLEKYRPSQLDEQLLSICPFYKAQNDVSQAYSLIHDIATSRILEKLQLRLSELSLMSEVSLGFGRVDGAVANRIALMKNGDLIAFIEVKTGRIKLLQPAIYTYLERVKTLIAELKTGEVLVVDFESAKRLVKEFIEHIKDKERLRMLGKKIPGKDCKYCIRNCEFRLKEGKNCNPLKHLPRVLDNVDVVVEKILKEVVKEIEESAGYE